VIYLVFDIRNTLSCGLKCGIIADPSTTCNENLSMNITLTMQFETLADLQEYLSQNPAAAAAPVAVATPAANVVEMPAATPAAPAVAAPTPAAPAVAAPTPAVVDLAAMKQTLMTRLRELAGSMDDPGELGKFINAFGVQRFSDLPDDQLPTFEAALNAEYPA
jgi:hypothetical protein